MLLVPTVHHRGFAGSIAESEASGIPPQPAWRTDADRPGRLEGLRDPERSHDLPFDRVLRPEYVSRALLHEEMEPGSGHGQPGAWSLSGDQHRRHAPGRLACRSRRPPRVIRLGFAGAAVFLALFVAASDRNLAMWLLVPLAVFIFMPTSVLVVLGQEYLPHRVGVASGVTLGLAVSVGGMAAPLLGRLGDSYGLQTVLAVLLGVLLLATGQAFALPPVGSRRLRETDLAAAVVAAERSM